MTKSSKKIKGVSEAANELLEESGFGQIGKIRDILMGEHIRQYEDRFAALEDRLEEHFALLKKELKSQVATLTEHAQAEVAERQKALQDLDQSLADSEQRLAASLSSLEDQSGQEVTALKLAMQEQEQGLSSEISGVQEALKKNLELESERLANDKVSREALAKLLDEVSSRLRES